jgi:hypothetical protein
MGGTSDPYIKVSTFTHSVCIMYRAALRSTRKTLQAPYSKLYNVQSCLRSTGKTLQAPYSKLYNVQSCLRSTGKTLQARSSRSLPSHTLHCTMYRASCALYGRLFRPVHQGLYLHPLCTVLPVHRAAFARHGRHFRLVHQGLYLHACTVYFRLCCTESIATVPPFGLIERYKWFDQIYSQ